MPKRSNIYFFIRGFFFFSLFAFGYFIVTANSGNAYSDPAACTKSWEFEPGLIPSNWRTLKGYLYNNSPAEFIGWFFTVALGFAGFLALVMIVVAGIEYTASAGNSASQSRAKERIQNALLGLGLLIASVVILGTINPSLTTLKNPTLPASPIGNSTAQTCTCTYETTLPGKTTCSSQTFCGAGENCQYNLVFDGPKGEETLQTQIYCCKFSDPPPPGGGGFGGGSSGSGGGGSGGGF